MRLAIALVTVLGLVAGIAVLLFTGRAPVPGAHGGPDPGKTDLEVTAGEALVDGEIAAAVARFHGTGDSTDSGARLRQALDATTWEVLPAREKWRRLRALIEAARRRDGTEQDPLGPLVWPGAERLGLEVLAWSVPAPLNASGVAGGFLYRCDDGTLASADIARTGEPDPRPSSLRRMRRTPVGWIWGYNPVRGGLYNMTSELTPTAPKIVFPRPEWRPDALILLAFCLDRDHGGSEPRSMFIGPRSSVVEDDDSLEVTRGQVVVRHLGLRVNGLYLLATEGFDRDRKDGRILPVGGLFVVETTGDWFPVSSEPPRETANPEGGLRVEISSDVVLAPIPDGATPCRIEKWSSESAWDPAGWEPVPGELRSKPLLHGRRALPTVVLREGAYRVMCRPLGRGGSEKGVGTHFVVRGGRVIVFPGNP